MAENKSMSFSDLQREMQIGKSKSVKNYSGQVSYNYRNAEQIFEHFKSLNSGWTLIVTDSIFEITGRLFVEATAIAKNGEEEQKSTAFAEHDEVPIFEKSGKQQMQKPQWTGAVSSYARKYALQGLFAIGENDVDDLQSENLNDTPKANENDGKEVKAKLEKINAQFERALRAAKDKEAPIDQLTNWSKMDKSQAIKDIAKWIKENEVKK